MDCPDGLRMRVRAKLADLDVLGHGYRVRDHTVGGLDHVFRLPVSDQEAAGGNPARRGLRHFLASSAGCLGCRHVSKTRG